nr:radical SAM protein [Bulleidia sp. zg-1006]
MLITDASSYKCNLRCVYCMQQNTFKDVKEISVKERVDIWQNLIEASGLQSATIVLFGGEPFLNLNYVNNLLTEATNRNLPIDYYSAVTNGVNLDANSIELLTKFPFSKYR